MDIFVCLLDILPRPGAAELRVALILVCRRVASALKHPATADPLHDERGVRTYEVVAAAGTLVTVVWASGRQEGQWNRPEDQARCAPGADFGEFIIRNLRAPGVEMVHL
jgi:hypothetical protein